MRRAARNLHAKILFLRRPQASAGFIFSPWRRDTPPSVVAGRAGTRRPRNGELRRTPWGVGSDISKEALAVAVENAKKLGIEAKFVQGDLFENVEGSFDMILSNPPYIRTSEIERLQEEVRFHDPIKALDGKEDGLYFYRIIVKESRQYLKRGGWLIFEIGSDQAEAVKTLLQEAGYENIEVKKDLAGLDRVVYGMYS